MDYARVLRLPQYFRNLQRLGEIVTVLVKHGFGDLVSRLNLYSYLESGLRLIRPTLLLEKPSSVDFGTRIRLVCEELGPTFIKFAQVVATRPDIFPEAITKELSVLHDQAPPFAVSQVTQVIEAELKRPLESVFPQFDYTPLAAASLAQVHKAQLKGGAEVVVKIQRPNIERTIDSDIDILRGLATLLEERIPESATFSPLKLVEEFERTMRRELDFRREAKNALRFAQGFSDEPDLKIPFVYPEYSSKKVLTIEFISGCKADQVDTLSQLGINGARITETLNRVVLKSIFEHRFFHADPHPGNVLITSEGKVAFIDFGAMGRIDRGRLQFLLKFFHAIFSKDIDRILNVIAEHQGDQRLRDELTLRTAIAEVLETHLGERLENLDVSRLLTDVFELVRRYGIRPPPDLLLIAKSLSMLESIGAALHPGFDPTEEIRPYLMRRYISSATDPKIHAAHASAIAESYLSLIKTLPDDVRSILRNFSRESLVFQIASKDLSALRAHQNSMLNRALMTAIGLAILGLGIFLMGLQDSRGDIGVSSALIALGALVLVGVWISIRKTGGTSFGP